MRDLVALCVRVKMNRGRSRTPDDAVRHHPVQAIIEIDRMVLVAVGHVPTIMDHAVLDHRVDGLTPTTSAPQNHTAVVRIPVGDLITDERHVRRHHLHTNLSRCRRIYAQILDRHVIRPHRNVNESTGQHGLLARVTPQCDGSASHTAMPKRHLWLVIRTPQQAALLTRPQRIHKLLCSRERARNRPRPRIRPHRRCV